MRRPQALMPILLFLLAACAGSRTEPSGQASAPPAPPSPGPPSAGARSCVPLTQIREARVIDDQTIDFYLNNREVLRNRLPHRCPSLGFEKAFTYATSLAQLCSTDTITVLYRGGGPSRGASCGLGTFDPAPPEPTR